MGVSAPDGREINLVKHFFNAALFYIVPWLDSIEMLKVTVNMEFLGDVFWLELS